MLDRSSEKTSAISFSEMPRLQYVWHPDLLTDWIIAFFLPANVLVISIGCSVSSTFLCQIILCCCFVLLNGCHVSIQRQLPICPEAGHKALTAQERIQPAVMPAGIKDLLCFGTLRLKNLAGMIIWSGTVHSSEMGISFSEIFRNNSHSAGNKKYWHKQVPDMRSCIAPRAGLDGAYLALQMDRSALGSALDHELGFLLQGFPAGIFQQEWGETEMLLEGFFQVHAGQKLTCGHKRALLSSLLLKRLRLENQMRNKGIKDLKNSSFLSTVEVLFSFNLCTIV